MNLHRRARTCPESRALLVRRVLEEGWTRQRTAGALGISERTTSKWLRRFRLEGSVGLLDRSSRPRRSPRRTGEVLRERIIELRGGRLMGREVAETMGLPRSTVGRILRQAGLGRLKSLEPPEPVVRYEVPHPGDLLHVDIKKLGRIEGGPGHRIHGDRRTRKRGVGWEHVYVCVDDHSRLSYVEPLEAESKQDASCFLQRAFSWFSSHGVTPRRLLTDNAKVFKSDPFRSVCQSFAVSQSFTRPYRPRTNGKAERFIQTMLREWAYRRAYSSSAERRGQLSSWLRYYNFHRRHSSLGDLPPASRVNNLLSPDT